MDIYQHESYLPPELIDCIENNLLSRRDFYRQQCRAYVPGHGEDICSICLDKLDPQILEGENWTDMPSYNCPHDMPLKNDRCTHTHLFHKVCIGHYLNSTIEKDLTITKCPLRCSSWAANKATAVEADFIRGLLDRLRNGEYDHKSTGTEEHEEPVARSAWIPLALAIVYYSIVRDGRPEWQVEVVKPEMQETTGQIAHFSLLHGLSWWTVEKDEASEAKARDPLVEMKEWVGRNAWNLIHEESQVAEQLIEQGYLDGIMGLGELAEQIVANAQEQEEEEDGDEAGGGREDGEEEDGAEEVRGEEVGGE